MNRFLKLGLPLLAITLTAVAISAAPQSAADPVITAVDVSGLQDGQSIIVTNNKGVYNVRPLVLLNPSNPNPGPTPIPIPVPTPINERSKLFQDAATKVTGDSSRDTDAKQLAILYRSLAAMTIPSGTSPPQITNPLTLKSVASQGADALLLPTIRPSWQPVRDLLGTQWTLVDAKGSGKIEDYAALLNDAATGLEASAPNKSIDPATLQMIIQLILTILKLFFPMG